MKKTGATILFVGILALLTCKREEPVPAGLTVLFSSPDPSTIDEVTCRAHLTGPDGLDTSDYLYRWDWESDGMWDTRYSAQPVAARIFGQAGSRRITAEALSAGGARFTASAELAVSQGYSAPVPAFVVTPDSGNFKTEFTFDARKTHDAQDSTDGLTFSWDFNNDQQFEVVQKGNPIARHTFPEDGAHTVNLLVTDTTRRWGRTSRVVNVNRIDTLIVPVWQVSPQYPSDLDTIRFDATGSYYRGDTAMNLRYSWRHARGAWSEPSEDPVYRITRMANGVYDFRLRVYSAEDLYNDKPFTVVVSRANKPPTAHIDRNMRFGNIRTVYEFSAWGSTDPDNIPSELMARWDFEGDGIWDTPFDKELKISHVYNVAGTYPATVEVVDPGGLTSSASTDIRVSPFGNPTGTIKDIRDGKVYGIVKIGEQWWMNENLRYDAGQDGFGDYFLTYCFNQNPAICEVSGRLYYADQVRARYPGDSETTNLCPRGWHIPTTDEWLELLQEVGREQAGTRLFYGGSSDFNILLGGYAAYHHYGPYTEFQPDSLYKVAYFMSMPISVTFKALQYIRNDTEVRFRDMTAEGYYSVRCVKDD